MSEPSSEIIQSAIAAIEAAFAGVRLGAGISVRQADAIDNYDDEEEQALARDLDEHDDWKRIADEVIMHTPSAMAFMDPAGILFHLPAAMCFSLRNYHQVSNCSVDAAMVRVTNPKFINRFKPQLTAEQIAAIVQFLHAYGEFQPGLKSNLESAAQLWLKN